MYRELNFKSYKKKNNSNFISFTKPSIADIDDSTGKHKEKFGKRIFQLLTDDLFQKLDDFSGTYPFSTKRKNEILSCIYTS